MYVGGLTLLIGFALALRSPAMLAFCGAWWLLAHALVLGYEEPVLRERFGQAYADYCGRVPRWIPRKPSPADAAGR
jgi:protein-S-isoprenylcysteine O-methyltransferase Ste14